MSYQLIVASIESIRPIEKADRIVAATILGNEVVVGIDSKVGDILIYAETDGIFKDDFCINNDLFPKLDANGKKIGGGFFTPGKARIRAQKFKGVKSHGFAFPPSYLSYTGYKINSLKKGDRFNELNGIKIAEKYYTAATIRAMNNATKQKKKQPHSLMMKEFSDVGQFRYYGKDIPKGALISLQNKKHGTSNRISYVLQNIELNKIQKFINKFIPIFKDKKREYLIGSRRVVLLPKDITKEGFHGTEDFRYELLPIVKDKLPLGFTLYGEITGWVNGKPIMGAHDLTKPEYKDIKNLFPSPMHFAYGDGEGQHTFTLYHATFANEDGYQIDLSWEEVKNLAIKLGIKHTFEFEPEFIYDGDIRSLQDRVQKYIDKPDPEDNRHYSEGVVIRATVGNKVSFYKEKGFYFKLGEGIVKSSDETVDMEESS